MNRIYTVLASAVALAAIPQFAHAQQRADYQAMAATHAQANGVPEALVHRVIMRESKYNAGLIGRGGCIGLMQNQTRDRPRRRLFGQRRWPARSQHQSHLRRQISRRRLSRRPWRPQPRGALLCRRLLLRRQAPAPRSLRAAASADLRKGKPSGWKQQETAQTQQASVETAKP